jgi:8-oxo-dGTP pyrophosphatase MutT (NUDIX family)
VAHWIVPVKPTPATPSPASTLVLLRDRPPAGVEVLLIQRHRASKFAAGDYVFPGGKIEVDDNPGDAAAWCAGLDAAWAARRLGLDGDGAQALRYWIGAIRECFEEVGVLLAYGADGAPAAIGDPRFAGYRRACQADNRAFWDMLRAERLRLATDQIAYFAHWITPEERPIRFDTRFFAAPMPAGQEAVADDREIVDVRWLTPSEAFAALGRGEISLRTPTQRNLALFQGAASAAEALARVDGRPVSTIRPRLVADPRGGGQRSLMPGDPGYF